jgi:hypothetical protein
MASSTTRWTITLQQQPSINGAPDGKDDGSKVVKSANQVGIACFFFPAHVLTASFVDDGTQSVSRYK